MPFGFGRSFTSFGYSGLTLLGAGVGTGTEKTTAGTYAACDDIRLQVTVENTGAIDSDEVVQLYTSTPDASVPAPRVRLADFARVHIKAGASATVLLTASPATRAVYYQRPPDPTGEDLYTGWKQQVVEKGTLSLFVGGGQPGYFDGGVAANTTITTNTSLANCA